MCFIPGLYHRNRCPKGKACNFLHVFQNPSAEFFDADRDYSPRRTSDNRLYNRNEDFVEF